MSGKTAIEKPGQHLEAMLKRMGPEISKALPKHISADRMSRIALTALRTTPKLAQATPASFLGSVIQASQLGLEVNTPLQHAYLLPYNRRNKTGQQWVECQLIIGYQGMLEITRRSGMVGPVYAFPVYQGDEFSYELGLNPSIRHVPSLDADHSPGNITHVYGVAKLKDGEPVFTVLSRAEVDRYRERSMSRNNGPWVTDYEAMALKTAIRRLFRWLPKSAEMAQAVALDEAPEIGRNQLAVSDPKVLELLQENNIELPVDAEGEESSETEEAPPAPVDASQNGRRMPLKGNKQADPRIAPEGG